MRGDAERQANMLLAVTPDSFIPEEHPIRRIKPIVESALARLSSLFDGMYADRGRPSIPPEHLLKASLLIALYSIRSERQFCERLRYDLLFKWFLDLNVSDEPFDASSFSKNRERLLAYDVPRAFFAEVVAEARQRRLLSADHFTVDGTLLEAWASLKSYRPRDVPGNERGTRGGPSPRSCSDTWCTPRSVPFGPAAARQRSARPARRRVDARGLTARAAPGSRSAVAGSPAHPTRRPRRPRGGRPAPRMPSTRP